MCTDMKLLNNTTVTAYRNRGLEVAEKHGV